jgi:hypothetical protein
MQRKHKTRRAERWDRGSSADVESSVLIAHKPVLTKPTVTANNEKGPANFSAGPPMTMR